MKKGFTIIESLVAVGLFSVFIGIAWGGFTNALRTQREIAAMVSAQSNASLALEQMAREMRTGYLFCHDPDSAAVTSTCQAYCGVVSGSIWQCNNFIQFRNAATELVAYQLENGALERESSSTGNFQPITSDNVNIQYLSFYLQGQLEGDHWNPRITISLGVSPSSTDPALKSDVVKLQTTVSGREIDCGSGSTGC